METTTFNNIKLNISPGDYMFSLYQTKAGGKCYRFGIRVFENSQKKFEFKLLAISNINSVVVGPIMDIPFHVEMESLNKDTDYDHENHMDLLEQSLISQLKLSVATCIKNSTWFKEHKELMANYKTIEELIDGFNDRIKNFEDGLYTITRNVPEKRKVGDHYITILVHNFDLADKLFVK